jgi:hypothetical protein
MRKVTEMFREHYNRIRMKPDNGRRSMQEIDEVLEQIYYTKERLCSSVKELDEIANGGNSHVNALDSSSHRSY